MDTQLQLNISEVEQLICDVRDHFKTTLEARDYANAATASHLNKPIVISALLQRCEEVLMQLAAPISSAPNRVELPKTISLIDEQIHMTTNTNTFENKGQTSSSTSTSSLSGQQNEYGTSAEIIPPPCSSYMEMNSNSKAPKAVPPIETSFRKPAMKPPARIPELINSVFDNIKDDNSDSDFDEGDNQSYDMCQISHKEPDESLTPIAVEPLIVECPYLSLPVSQMIIQNPSKCGQLQRVEKRLFFDQTKKYYCGILNSWLLCYTDGNTAAKPTLTMHLKRNSIEIEHYGDGKRRELSFQIITGDPNLKLIFQAANEVDAKEWIVAVEAAIRGESVTVAAKCGGRKLPTPPAKHRAIIPEDTISECGSGILYQNFDYIYEVPTQGLRRIVDPPKIPARKNAEENVEVSMEYDIPPYPAQPIVKAPEQSHTELETVSLLNLLEENTSGESEKDSDDLDKSDDEKRDFHTFIKEMHNKLSSQLTAGPNNERSKKMLKKTCSDPEATVLASPPAFVMNNKKLHQMPQSSTPTESPQKQDANAAKKSHEEKSDKSEKSPKNWFLIRLTKGTRNSANNNSPPSPKSKQSERQNLLALEWYDNSEGDSNANEASVDECDSSAAKSVNMIIKELEARGHVGMFSVEALKHNVVASFHDSDNNYEPIMAISTPVGNGVAKKD